MIRRVLTPTQRRVLEWLEEHDGRSWLELFQGKPGFIGYALDRPRCGASTFLTLAQLGCIAPDLRGDGGGIRGRNRGDALPTTARNDGELPDAPGPDNVVPLQRRGFDLARYFFELSQMISNDSLAVHPIAMTLVLAGPTEAEVLSGGHTAQTHRTALAALLKQHFRPDYWLSALYAITDAGRWWLGYERDFDAVEAAGSYRERDELAVALLKRLRERLAS